MNERPFNSKRIALYVLLQTLTLVFCWGWFALWWSVAFFGFSMDQIEWWLLFLTSLAGLYGLRPNLERLIDSYWLGKSSSPAAIKEKVEQLRPVKRRIDVTFSIVVMVMLVLILIIWYGFFNNGPSSSAFFAPLTAAS